MFVANTILVAMKYFQWTRLNPIHQCPLYLSYLMQSKLPVNLRSLGTVIWNWQYSLIGIVWPNIYNNLNYKRHRWMCCDLFKSTLAYREIHFSYCHREFFKNLILSYMTLSQAQCVYSWYISKSSADTYVHLCILMWDFMYA